MKPTMRKKTTMKAPLGSFALALALCAAPTSHAAVPLRWQVETSRVQPVQFIAYHGETLRLEAALQSYGKPLAATNEALVCWQTNGMGGVYWTAPASVSNNVLSAGFTPAMDPGAELVNGFLGVPGENWRAAFQLRFRPSPGASPSFLPLPVQTLDFSKIEVLNPPWPDEIAAATNALDSSLSSRLSQVSRSAADYTDATIAAATNAIPQPDLSSCVRTDENGAATLKYHGNNEGAIDIVPGSGGTPYPLISVKNPNWTEARIRVGTGDGEDFRGILIDDTPNQGRRIRIDGNYSDNVDIGYDDAFVPHITVNGTNILPVVFAAAESNSVHAAAIAEMLGQIADVAEMASSERSWNRPGDWGLSYLPELSDVTVSSMSIVTNDYGMILSNSTQGATQGLSARMYAENVDPTSQTEPPTIVSLEVAGGFASNNVVTVTSNGNFHVKGIASNGEAREAVVSFSGGTSTAKNYSIYIADSPAFVSRMVTHNFVVGALDGMELAESGTDGSRNAYNFYTANYPQFGTGPAQGHFRPFAIAPKLMATAAHYPWFPAADGWSRPVTYYYHDGTWANTYTVKGNGTHFNLATWALTNGFTQAEVAAAGISDTEILPLLDGWNFPAEECPYFATPEWVAANYGSLYGMTIWAQTQKSVWCIPCTVSRVVNGGIGWQTPSSITPGSFRPRADIAALVGDYNALDWWRVQTGDSGKPLFLESYHEGSVRHIVVSHFHSVGGGPNYVAASRILAKLCQQYNTTIKLLQ